MKKPPIFWWLQGLVWVLTLILAPATAQSAQLFIDGGATYTVNGNINYNREIIGHYTSGTVNQGGFTNTVKHYLFLGYYAGSSGAYNLSGGGLSATGEIIGKEGVGTFKQIGGSNNTTFLILGSDSGGSGIYNQSGGSVQSEFLSLGDNSGSTGTYNLSGGSLTAAFETIGAGGVGTFNQSGGSNNTTFLEVGTAPLGGTYNLNGGTLSAYYLEIGWLEGGIGTFNQSGGTNQTQYISVGAYAGSLGTYNLRGGTTSASGLTVASGGGGVGIFNQSGGSIQADIFYLGWGPGSKGTFNLSGGSLSADNQDIGREGGVGVFNQSGGSNQTQYISVGTYSGSLGTYNLSGGSLTATGLAVGSGGGGVGVFNQSGGSNQSGLLYLGWGPGSSGTYNLSAGSLTSSTQKIGLAGNGIFNQSGGSNQTDLLTVGESVSDGGTLYPGVGAYNQSGGTNNVNQVILGVNGGSGVYNLTSGSLTSGVMDISADSAFNFTGGAFNSTTLNNAGVVYAGPGCTMNVGGNFAQMAGGNLSLGIASPASYGKISIGAAASLNGTLTPVLLGGYRPQVNQVFTGILTAGGGLNGNFTLADPWISPTLYWQQRYSNTSLDLLVARGYTNPGLGLTSNQAAVGAVFNGLAGITSGDLGGVLDSIDSLSRGSEVANAFQQISPDKAASLATLGFAGAGLFRRGLANRITNLRYRSLAGIGEASSLGGFNLNYSQAAGLMLAYNSSSLAGLVTAKKQAAPASPWGVYLDPALALGSQKSSGNQTGFNFTIAGFTAGADYRVRHDLLVGLATGYSHTGASFRGSGGAVENNTWPLTAYAAYLPGSFYAYGSLGYALNLFSLERNLSWSGLSRTTTASPVGHQFNAYGEAGYDLKTCSLVLTPLVSLAYSKLWVSGFTETGGGSLNLNVDAQQADSLQTGVGARIAAPLKRHGVIVTPQAYATYQHEFSDTSRGLDARLSQGGVFAFQSENLGQNFAVLGASVTLTSQKNFSLYLDYNTELGRENYTAHNLTAGLRYEF